MSSKFGYTLVQHSGYGYADKPGFDKGLETREICTRAERNLVERVGGVVYEDYVQADEAAFELMYPPGNPPHMLYPCFQGTFSEKKIDGLRIAIPKRVVVA